MCEAYDNVPHNLINWLKGMDPYSPFKGLDISTLQLTLGPANMFFAGANINQTRYHRWQSLDSPCEGSVQSTAGSSERASGPMIWSLTLGETSEHMIYHKSFDVARYCVWRGLSSWPMILDMIKQKDNRVWVSDYNIFEAKRDNASGSQMY